MNYESGMKPGRYGFITLFLLSCVWFYSGIKVGWFGMRDTHLTLDFSAPCL